jgi:hypothetical protein
MVNKRGHIIAGVGTDWGSIEAVFAGNDACGSAQPHKQTQTCGKKTKNEKNRVDSFGN